MRYGAGTLEWPNGQKCQGKLRLKKFMDGYGVEKTEEGTYEGEFKDGQWHGKGTFIWNNDGKDLLTFESRNKKKYTGDWKMGKMSGRGVLEF